MRHVIAWPAVVFAGGIAAGVAATPSPVGAAVLLVAALAVSVGCLRRGAAGPLFVCVMAGWLAAGVALGSEAESRARHPSLAAQVERLSPDGLVRLTGRLREDASRTPSGVTLSLLAESVGDGDTADRAAGGVHVTVFGDFAPPAIDEWRAGRRLLLTARLRRPSRYENPGVPDHRLALARRGTVLVGSVKSAALVQVLARGSWIEEIAGRARRHIRRRLSRSVGRLSDRSAAIVSAVLIGDRAGLDDRVERRLQEAGTYHVIAISGGNIAVFTVCLLLAARLLRLPWRARLALTAAGLLLYGEVATGGSSVSRAIVVAIVYLAATALDQRSGAASALAVAALVILCATPLALLDAGFVLTFGATMAIVAGVPRLLPRMPIGPARAAAAVTAASLAAELALLPVGTLFFSRVTLAGPVLNLAAVPLMSVVQVGGMAVVAASWVSPAAADLVAWVPHLASDGLVRSAGLVEHLPWLTWRAAPPPWWLVVGYYAAAGTWLWRRSLIAWMTPYQRLGARLVTACAAGAGLLVVSTPLHSGIHRTPGVLRVSVLDVGQGDATLLQMPDGGAILVDTGGLGGEARFDVGERVVAPALWWLGIRRLDTLALTHGHPDHIGGAPALLDMFGPHEIWDGVPVRSHEPLAALRRDASARGTRWRAVRAGDEVRLAAVTIRALHPPQPDWERQRVRNDDSIVLDVRYGAVSVLLPGDVSAEVERALIPALVPAAVRVLKVAHHGSASSTDAAFLDALRPQIAIVSCGRENRYGHPAPGVLARLRTAGARVYRTDQEGAVVVETDGTTARVAATKARKPEGTR